MTGLRAPAWHGRIDCGCMYDILELLAPRVTAAARRGMGARTAAGYGSVAEGQSIWEAATALGARQVVRGGVAVVVGTAADAQLGRMGGGTAARCWQCTTAGSVGAAGAVRAGRRGGEEEEQGDGEGRGGVWSPCCAATRPAMRSGLCRVEQGRMRSHGSLQARQHETLGNGRPSPSADAIRPG